MNKDTFLNPIYTSNQKEMSVIKYEKSQNFYLLSFTQGKKTAEDVEKNIKYFIDVNDKVVDLISEPHRTPIVSERLRDLILKYEKNIQVFDAPLFEFESKKKVSGYFILNYLNVLTCVDLSRSTLSSYDNSVFKPVIIESKVPHEVCIFKLKESIFHGSFFRKELALAIHKAGMTGIQFLTTQSY